MISYEYSQISAGKVCVWGGACVCVCVCGVCVCVCVCEGPLLFGWLTSAIFLS